MFVVLLAAACSREATAPPQDAAPRETATTTTAPAAPASAPFEPAHLAYAEAVTWFRTTPGFHFKIEEGDVTATGVMVRPRIGEERVRFTVAGQEWIAEAGPRGVVWKRGGAEAPAPEWGNRLYQRVTVAFDPEKREGQAQLAGPGHYRFTDANSGALHQVWVDDAGHITRMQIGDSMSMTVSLPQ